MPNAPYTTLALAFLLIATAGVTAQESSLLNPTRRACRDELVRLRAGVQLPVTVKLDGAEVPHQVERIDGADWIWVCSDFASGATNKYVVAKGQGKAHGPRVTLKREGDAWVLDNGQVAVKVPAQAGPGELPGPISAVKVGDKWVGGSFWKTERKLKNFSSTVIGDGTLFAKVRLRYDFDGMAGLNADLPAFAEVDVTLGPSWNHAAIFERHEMGRRDHWELEASRGWTPDRGIGKPFSAGPGGPPTAGLPAHDRPLKPGAVPFAPEELFINLFPRWNQHYKDGWHFVATDGAAHVGAVVVKASKWIWPHDNSIRAVVKASGQYAGLRAPTWKGQRLWWLVTSMAPTTIEYVTRHAWEDLDKLNHDFILEWPGKAGGFSGMNFYDGSQINPTGGIRGAGRSAIANAGKPGDLSTLTRAQVMFHGDSYGSYWNFWSSENPNFFTDYIRVPVGLTTNLKTHPRFEELRRTAELRLMEDVYHSVTLPGGAGQECPGYSSHGHGGWDVMAAACREHLGFDPGQWERVKAVRRFLRRISQPDGEIRRALPMGDTHPGKDGPKAVDVPADEVKTFVTEELPGFGAIFSNNPGTPRETYLAFKSGPNRGHYHGDQLAFHYGALARPLAVDHHCSYAPRAGQEHMHNRVAFSTGKFSWANMDGYERLIAFKTSPSVDVAMGQVESDRLRQVTKLPPEDWHAEYPQHALARPLVYRRTVVFMKGGAQDYFVIRDQYWGDADLAATYCLHVRSDKVEHTDRAIDFGNLTLFCASPAKFAFESFPWSHKNGGGESTQGARLTVPGGTGQFITVLYPGKAPAIEPLPGGVKVGDDQITFAGDQPTSGDAVQHVTVRRGGDRPFTLPGSDINLDRSQGEIGLFVPDAGYPFGDIPDWLIRQRIKRPDWAK